MYLVPKTSIERDALGQGMNKLYPPKPTSNPDKGGILPERQRRIGQWKRRNRDNPTYVNPQRTFKG
jgi:hypothetical protein